MKNDTDLAGLVAGEVAKRLTPIEDLLKSLEQPASKAGLSPQEFLARATNGGKDAATFGHMGNLLATSQGVQRRSAQGLGWGKMLCSMAELSKPGVTADSVTSHMNYLFGPTEKGGLGITKAALAENSGVTGGYTVPPQFAQQLMTLAVEDSVIEPRASKMPMSSMTLQVPSLDYTTTATSGQSPFLGGVVASWTSEAATRAESEPTFRQTELKAWELSFYTVASNNLLADNAVGLDSLLTQLFSSAIGWYTDYAYLRGDGVGKPLGIVNAPATISVSRGTSNRVRYVDVATMLSRLLLQSQGSAIWLASQSVIPDLLQMHDSSGNQTAYGAGRLIWASIDQGAAKAPPPTLLGFPIYFTEKCAALGTKGDIMLIDPTKYLVGKRTDLEIAVSPHVKFLNNQMVWRVVWRGDGQPWLNSSITLADGSTTVSPFVALAT